MFTDTVRSNASSKKGPGSADETRSSGGPSWMIWVIVVRARASALQRILYFFIYIYFIIGSGVFCNLSWSVLKCVDLDGPENTPAPNTTLPAAFDVLKWRMIVNGCRDSLLFFSSPFFPLYFCFLGLRTRSFITHTHTHLTSSL